MSIGTSFAVLFALLSITTALHAQQRAAPNSPHRYFDLRTKMDVDVDGAPNAYGPPGKPTLDTLRNARLKDDPTQIVGFVVDDNNKPVLQTAHDPYPGYYVSTTAFCDNCDDGNERDPKRYIDARKVNYVVLGRFGHRHGVRLGDLAAVHSRRFNKTVFAVVGDDGNPSGGEGSLHLLRALGYPFVDGRDGTAPRRDITIRYFPHSNPARRFFHTQAQIDAEARRLKLNAKFSSRHAAPK
jgi:hypothetical protein